MMCVFFVHTSKEVNTLFAKIKLSDCRWLDSGYQKKILNRQITFFFSLFLPSFDSTLASLFCFKGRWQKRPSCRLCIKYCDDADKSSILLFNFICDHHRHVCFLSLTIYNLKITNRRVHDTLQTGTSNENGSKCQSHIAHWV